MHMVAIIYVHLEIQNTQFEYNCLFSLRVHPFNHKFQFDGSVLVETLLAVPVLAG